MSPLLWASSALGWTLFGFLLGWIVANLTRDTKRLAEATERGFYPFLDCGEVFMGEPPTEDLVQKARSRRAVFTPRLIVGLVIVVLGILTAVQGIVTSNRLERLQQCQAQYSNGFADALDARTAATRHSQQALDDMVRSIRANLGHNDPKAAAALSGAIDHYLAQRNAAVVDQRAHPYPAPPRESCQ